MKQWKGGRPRHVSFSGRQTDRQTWRPRARRHTPGSGSSRSARPDRAASRGTSARCRSPRRSRTRRTSGRRRWRPPTTRRPRAAWPCSLPRRRVDADRRDRRLARASDPPPRSGCERSRWGLLPALVLSDRATVNTTGRWRTFGCGRRTIKPSPTHSAAMRIRSALSPSSTALEALPSPGRRAFSEAGTSRSSKKSPSSRGSSSCGSAGSSGRGRSPAARPRGGSDRPSPRLSTS